MKDKLKIEKYINDNIYGGIGITRKEFEIINTRAFQRLRRIKQQGFNSYVFPSADHTRFSHSLGVLHIMGKMVDRLIEIEEIMNFKDVKMLRYAALLHDIGHYPLSHLTEAVYNTIENNEGIENGDLLVSSKSKADNNESIFKRFSMAPKLKPAHHEKLGKFVILYRDEIRNILLNDGLDESDILEIGNIITGETINILFHQCMHSSFDADRLDYLIRDSRAAGVNYGLIDLDYLIRLIEVGKEHTIIYKSKEKRDKFIGINKKGIHALEHYLMARYFSYSQITMHRTSSTFEALAKVCLWHLYELKKIPTRFSEIVDFINTDEFIRFDDSYMLSRFGEMEYFDGEWGKLRETLIERKRIKVLIEIKEITGQENRFRKELDIKKVKEYIENNLEDIAKKLNINKNYIGYTEQSLKIECNEKDIEIDAKDYVESAKVYSDNECIHLCLETGTMVRELLDKKLSILRVFYIDPEVEKEKSDFKRKIVYDEIIDKLKEA